MAEAVSNDLIYELLKRVHDTQSQHTRFHQETRERLGSLEMQYASISRRVDRIDERVERIERRLDISDAPVAGE